VFTASPQLGEHDLDIGLFLATLSLRLSTLTLRMDRGHSVA
jgi:hypothetical protein